VRHVLDGDFRKYYRLDIVCALLARLLRRLGWPIFMLAGTARILCGQCSQLDSERLFLWHIPAESRTVELLNVTAWDIRQRHRRGDCDSLSGEQFQFRRPVHRLPAMSSWRRHGGAYRPGGMSNQRHGCAVPSKLQRRRVSEHKQRDLPAVPTGNVCHRGCRCMYTLRSRHGAAKCRLRVLLPVSSRQNNCGTERSDGMRVCGSAAGDLPCRQAIGPDKHNMFPLPSWPLHADGT